MFTDQFVPPHIMIKMSLKIKEWQKEQKEAFLSKKKMNTLKSDLAKFN